MCTPNNVPYISIETKHMILLTEAKKYNEFEVIADQLNNRINNFILKLQKINIIDDILFLNSVLNSLKKIVYQSDGFENFKETATNCIDFFVNSPEIKNEPLNNTEKEMIEIAISTISRWNSIYETDVIILMNNNVDIQNISQLNNNLKYKINCINNADILLTSMFNIMYL